MRDGNGDLDIVLLPSAAYNLQSLVGPSAGDADQPLEGAIYESIPFNETRDPLKSDE